LKRNKNDTSEPKNEDGCFNEPEKEDLTGGGVIERKKIAKS
jgi:hypothetical protein